MADTPTRRPTEGRATMKLTSSWPCASRGRVMTHPIKPLFGVILLCAGIATALPATSIADVYVISNPTATVSAGDIKDIFLGEKQLSGSTKLAPVDNSAAQSEFLAKVMQLDSVKYYSLWTKKSFRDGVNPPALKASDAD